MNISVLTNPRGANYRQLNSLKKLVAELIAESETKSEGFTFAHTGEKQNQSVHSVGKAAGFGIVIHPTKSPDISDGKVLPSTSNTERNRALVDTADIVIAIPMVVFEYEDSPLFKTVNYAISRGKDTYLLSPRGNVYQVWNTKDSI
jgi:hypothetical protein